MNVHVDWINIVLYVVIWIVALKAIIIGSDFDFGMFFRDGSDYLEWYRSRPKYQPKEKRSN